MRAPIVGAAFRGFVDRSALPANYYIYPASAQGGYNGVNGNDANNGTSRATPWATFAHANSVVVAGKTVAVAPGNYPQSSTLELTTVGSAGSPVIYRSDKLAAVFGGQGAARIYPNNTTFPTNGTLVSLGAVSDGTGAYITFDGFEVDGLSQTQIGSGHNVQLGVGCAGDHSTCRSCYVHDICIAAITGTGSVGIDAMGQFYPGENHTIDGNFVFRIFGPAPYNGPGLNSECQAIYYTGLGTIIRNNLVLGCAGQCISTFHGSDTTTIANNTCLWGDCGFIIYSSLSSGAQYNGGKCTNAVAFNNIAAHNVKCGIETYCEGSLANIAGYAISNNLLFTNGSYGNFFDGDSIGTVNGSPFTSNSPVNFVNDAALSTYPAAPAGNFRLASASVAAFRNGISTLSSRSAPTIDILGRSRGSNYDIGCYRY